MDIETGLGGLGGEAKALEVEPGVIPLFTFHFSTLHFSDGCSALSVTNSIESTRASVGGGAEVEVVLASGDLRA